MITVMVMWVTLLLLARAGRIGFAGVGKPLNMMWLSWPIAIALFVLAMSEMGGSLPERFGSNTDPFEVFVEVVPIAGFGLLLLSEIISFLFSYLGPRRAFAGLRHPVMSVHAVSLLYYLFEPPVDQLKYFDAFHRPLHPIRYIMWMISVSSMCMSLYVVVESLLSQTSSVRDVSPEALQTILYDALLGCIMVFATGYAGSVLRVGSTMMLNGLFFLLSIGSMIFLLVRVTSMLTFASQSRVIVAAGMSQQFKAIRAGVLIVWSAFPVVWVVAACNMVTPIGEHIGYMGCDLCAKYMIMYVYLTHVNV